MLFDTLHHVLHLVEDNPQYGLWAAFFFAFIESLAVIGSIIPGSVTMTAIGSLIGAGAIPLITTLIISAIGAYLGDMVSYGIGYRAQNKIHTWTWLKPYQSWIDRSHNFIQSHGIKSILIGRFFGPFRSFIPLAAGLLNMQPVKFCIAACIASILWSIVYLMPGFFSRSCGPTPISLLDNSIDTSSIHCTHHLVYYLCKH